MLEDLRAARGAYTTCAECILQRDRHACERPERLTARALRIDRACLLEHLVACDGEERIELAVHGVDTAERVQRDRDRRGLAALHPSCDRDHVLVHRALIR